MKLLCGRYPVQISSKLGCNLALAALAIGLSLGSDIGWTQEAKPAVVAGEKPALKRKNPLAGLRKWTNSTGKFKIEAEFVSLEDEQVTLKKADGTILKMPLAKLSEADQEIAAALAELAKADVAEPDTTTAPKPAEPENPFESAAIEPATVEPTDVELGGFTGPGKPAAPPRPATPLPPDNPTDSVDPVGIKLTTPDLTDLSPVMVEESETGVLPADPAPPLTGELTTKGTILSKGAVLGRSLNESRYDHAKSLLLNPTSMEALVGYLYEPPTNVKEVRLERVSLVTGKSTGSYALNSNGLPVSLAPDGKTLLCLSDNLYPGTKCRLDAWTLTDKGPEHLVSFKPYGDREAYSRDIRATEMVGNEHAYTVDNKGELTLWHLAGAKAVYTFPTSANSPVALSPGGKYLACMTGNGLTGSKISVFEALTGKTVAQLDFLKGHSQRISFRPDGKQLAALCLNELLVWDLTTGKQLHQFFVPGLIASSSIEWPDEGYLLLGGMSLVDIEKKVLLWYYGLPGEAFASMGGQHWYVLNSPDGNNRGLFHVTLPHAAAKKVAQDLNADELLIMKPGSEVAVTVKVDVPEAEKQALTEKINSLLTAQQLKVVPQAKITIEALSERVKEREVEFRNLGFGLRFAGRGYTTVKVAEVHCKITLRYGEEVLWTHSTTHTVPHVIHSKDDQTPQQAVDQTLQPNIGFYTALGFPGLIARPGKVTTPFGNFYGSSSLTGQGVQ